MSMALTSVTCRRTTSGRASSVSADVMQKCSAVRSCVSGCG